MVTPYAVGTQKYILHTILLSTFMCLCYQCFSIKTNTYMEKILHIIFIFIIYCVLRWLTIYIFSYMVNTRAVVMKFFSANLFNLVIGAVWWKRYKYGSRFIKTTYQLRWMDGPSQLKSGDRISWHLQASDNVALQAPDNVAPVLNHHSRSFSLCAAECGSVCGAECGAECGSVCETRSSAQVVANINPLCVSSSSCRGLQDRNHHHKNCCWQGLITLAMVAYKYHRIHLPFFM